MKQAEFIKQVLAGKPLVLGEYRNTEKDEINRNVVKAGESATMPIIKHKFIVGDDSFEFPEFPKNAAEFAKYEPPFKTRDMVVIEVHTMEKTKWGARISGALHGKLES